MVFLCFSILYIINVQGQSNDIYTAYGINEGVPQSSIWCIMQDKNGFLWAGTADGACRFDGYNFIVYRNVPGDVHSLPGGVYVRLYVDSTGTLWAISPDGLSIYNDIKDNFTAIFSHKSKRASPRFNILFGEDEKYVWAGITGEGEGLVRIDKHTHKATFINNIYDRKGVPFISSLNGFISKGKIWMSGVDATLCVYDIKTGNISRPETSKVFAASDFNDSEVLCATTEGLLLINKKTLGIKRLNVTPPIAGIDGVKVLFRTSDTELIVGGGKGMLYVDTRTWHVKRAVRSFNHDQKVSYANVQCVYRDRSDNLWIGTNGDGLKKLTAPYKNFKYYYTKNANGNIVKSLYDDGQLLYAGYFSNGIDIFHHEKGFIKNLVFKNNLTILKHVYGIAKIADRTLFITTGNSHICTYDLKNKKLINLSKKIEKVLPDFPNIINNEPFLTNTGKFVYANAKEYLLSFDVSSPKNIKPAVVHRFIGETLSCAYKDNKNRLWIGSFSGAWCIDNGKVMKIDLPDVVLVKSFCTDGQGNTWIATILGIYIVDDNKKLVARYNEANGLPNRFVYGILRDEHNNMWISHNKGISVYNPVTRSFRNYTSDDGLQSNEFNTGAFFKAADGTLYFGGINGTNGFKPGEIKDNPHVPVIKITDIKVFDRPFKTDSAYWYLHTIRLPYDSNSVSFEFTGIEFTNPRQNRYMYTMEGLDKNWIAADDRRFARYAAIPPGNYTFKVKACNNDGIWQNIPATISIIIVPPFWQQLWFKILLLVAFGSCIAGIILLVQRQRYKRRLRTIELHQKIQIERERISRDLHDNVGTQLSLISNNIDWVQHPLKVISDSEKADKLQFVSDVAKDIIATLRETIWALNKEQISLEEFSDKLKVFVHKQVSLYPSIKLAVNEQIDGSVTLGPSEALNLFRISQEAVANALKYAEAINISVDIIGNEGGYRITINDDGKGFDSREVDPSVQNGLENMRYRADDIGASFEINAAKGRGTAITITKK
jgi:signal transduction histidine kinase/ligand-binding sensor domain-containing protein